MVTLIRKHDDLVTLGEAKEMIRAHYPKVNDVTKLKLKCWLYYCEGRNEGGKDSLPFNQYLQMVSYTQLIEMIRGCVIDVSDLGGKDVALSKLSKWYLNN